MKNSIFRERPSEVMRYLIVAGSTYIADLLVYLLFIMISPSWYLQGNVAGRLVGALLGFLMHRHWTFGGHHLRSRKTQAISYSLLLLLNIGLSSALLIALQTYLPNLGPILSRGCTDTLVISFTFLCSRHIFHRQSSPAFTDHDPGNQIKSP